MILYVKPEYESNSVKVNEIANHIESMRFVRFVSKIQVLFETYGKPIHPRFIGDVKMIKSFEEHNPNVAIPNDLTNWVIRYDLNKLKMILKNMDLETIIFALQKTYPDMFIVYNSENDDNIVIRCHPRNTMFKKMPELDDVKDLSSKIKTTVIRGVNGIRIARVIKNNKSFVGDDGSIQSKSVFSIKTNGSNLSAILENPYLDTDNCQTDAIKEVEDIFGIEAARNCLRFELEKLLSGISQAHYSLYADEMCFTGTVTGISRTGLEKREAKNILLRTSYSFSNQVLRIAAVNNRLSKVYGMSAPIMLGSTPNVGSTYNQICIDQQFVKDNTQSITDLIDDL